MVSRILTAIQKKYTSVTEAAFIISFFTFMSQLLGVIRDRLFAYYIGPGQDLDVYLAAFRVPDFLYIILSTLISATVLIPLLAKDESETERKRINTLFSVFLMCVIVLSVLTMLLMPLIARLVAPGFSSIQTDKLILLSRIMLISPIMLGISNFIGSINQYYKKFFAYATAPVMYNLGIIFGIIFFYRYFGLFGLGLGVIMGGLLHLLTQLLAYRSSPYTLTLTKVKDMSVITDVLRVSIPRTVTLSLSSLLLLILTAIASFLGPGSISLMTFALNIAFVPLGLIGIPFATASFPYLVSLFKEKNPSVNLVIEATLEKIIFWTSILVTLFIIYRAHIVRIILGTELFSWEDTAITAALVLIFSIGILFQAVNHLFIRVYYAKNNTRKPLLISFIGFFITLLLLYLIKFTPPNVLSQAMVDLLRLITRENTQIILVAFVYTIGMGVTTCLFLYHYIKDHKHPILKFFLKCVLVSIGHAFVLGALCKIFLYLFQNFAKTKTLIGVVVQSGLSFSIAVILWFIYLFVVKNEHTHYISLKIKSIFSSHKIILEETQDL
jgi:putative peptidoglycan lipid II flippase